MTTDDDHPEPPIVLETQAAAEQVVQSITDMLAIAGWDIAIVSVARRVALPDEGFMAPGATGLHVDRRRMGPALENEASALEWLAASLRKMADTRNVEVTRAYVQDKSDYSTLCREWPK